MICLVCGFDKLLEEPYPDGEGSYEICPSCGFQFGVSDQDRHFTFDEWRRKWILAGTPWSGHAQRPFNWNPAEQLKRIGVSLVKE